MITQAAIQLRDGDVFTNNDGADWYHIVHRLVVSTNSGMEAVLVMTDHMEKVWLWADEEVVVRI